MSDAKKTHALQLGNGPLQEVTAAELAAVQAFTGNAFAQYTVTPLAEQPPKPADLPAAARPHKEKATGE